MNSADLAQIFERAVALHQQGRLDEAEGLYRSILNAVPNQADTLHHLGIVFAQRENHNESIKYFRRALKHNPRWPEVLSNMGNALRSLKRHSESIAAYRQALAIRPGFVDALYNLGIALHDGARYDEAVDVLKEALAVRPHDAELFNLLGVSLSQLGRYEEAIGSLRNAISIRPDLVAAHSNLGNVLDGMNRSEEAIACHRAALELDSKFRDAHHNLANALRNLHRYDEAAESCRRAIELDPGYHKAHNNLGNIYAEQERYVEAMESFKRTLAIRPDYPEAHLGLGISLSALGRYEEAVSCFRRATALKKDYADAHSSLIFAFGFMPGIGFKEHADECRAWYERHGRSLGSRIGPHGNEVDPSRKLRIGYVSSDFRQHSASAVFGPVIHRHDRSQYSVVLYSGVRVEDEASVAYRRSADLWRSTTGMSDEQLAERIRADRIDILVDLSAFSAGSRLLVFARKPAPIQVTGWGYAVSTGLATMDYHFSDPVAVPPEARHHYTETVIDLPCCVGFEPPQASPDESPAPSLSGEPVTFGCLNRLSKISDGAARLWCRLLEEMPKSRLLLKDRRLADPAERKRVADLFGAHGIEAQRLVLLPGTSQFEHLAAYGRVDVVLDPFPHTGGVSTLEALWMGVPVVTLLGRSFPARVSGAILSALGLSQWIGHNEDEYIAIAKEVAENTAERAARRASLRSLVRTSILCDEQYCRSVEAAYRNMWIKYCAERLPQTQRS